MVVILEKFTVSQDLNENGWRQGEQEGKGKMQICFLKTFFYLFQVQIFNTDNSSIIHNHTRQIGLDNLSKILT
jgi:hypothetical protein